MTRVAPARGAVAAGHALTAQAAGDVLRAGGNAFDAAIAGLWMACVAEPVLASPGGGGFLMAREAASGETVLHDFFVRTPLARRGDGAADFHEIHADFGPASQAFHIGRAASATPGFVPGLFAVHAAHATRPMAELAAPAACRAREGVEVTAFQAYLAAVVGPILTASEGARALFAPDGRLPRAGDIMRNPTLADMLDEIGREGLKAYRAKGFAARLLDGQGDHGHLRAEDLADYRVERRAPLKVPLGPARIALNPPPSAGGAFIAHALSAYAHAPGRSAERFAAALARSDEARRTAGGDPAALLADAGLALPAGGAAKGPPATRGTTHISVIDAAGNAVAATVSNGEGNGHVPGGLGFMLNNMLGEADLAPDGLGTWPPGLRPASMMCPAIAEKDGALFALGSGGSSRIRSALFVVLARLLAKDYAPDAAVRAPRLHVEDGHLDFEDFFKPGGGGALAERFPARRAWGEPNMFFGGAHVVKRHGDGRFEAMGDPRRDGVALVVD
ncbi:gamma-glutamyltransferase [Kaustia mangrovi]|uniref:Gamma-glutamyltransferase n=1 Tax=Kaustia mangrovi TaxID=2593653 RepID=A0A7S8C3B4_9HYPH|nr:gamma-glutamyltransferase [Kaustia mangrovi]QPC42547.1 gamma-glutamyltransferase [Kaustia mangrovi]